ncbi:dTDP-4-amino-4,6-dideoxygalactose transaminase [compost metagenome]
MYQILVAEGTDRQGVLQDLKAAGIGAVFHYVPLHSSPAGMEFGRAHGDLSVTDDIALRLIRLPLWLGLAEDDQVYVAEELRKSLTARSSAVRKNVARPSAFAARHENAVAAVR